MTVWLRFILYTDTLKTSSRLSMLRRSNQVSTFLRALLSINAMRSWSSAHLSVDAMCNTYMNCFPYTCIQRAKLFLPPSISSVSDSLTMRHSCVDWGATQPTRKAPFLVFSYGNRHLYAAVPKSFDVRRSFVHTPWRCSHILA